MGEEVKGLAHPPFDRVFATNTATTCINRSCECFLDFRRVHIGLGDEFDASKLEAYPPGSVIILPGNTHHFHRGKSGEYVTQITAIGPLGLEYLSAKDDPRNNSPWERSERLFAEPKERVL